MSTWKPGMSTVGKDGAVSKMQDLTSYPQVTQEENGTYTARFKDLTIKDCLSEKEAVAGVIRHYHSMVQGTEVSEKEEQDDSDVMFKDGFFRQCTRPYEEETYYNTLFYPDVQVEEDGTFTARCRFRGLAANRASKESAVGAMIQWYCELSRAGHLDPKNPEEPGVPPIQHVLNVLTEHMQNRVYLRDRNRQEVCNASVPVKRQFKCKFYHGAINLERGREFDSEFNTSNVTVSFLDKHGKPWIGDGCRVVVDLTSKTMDQALGIISAAWNQKLHTLKQDRFAYEECHRLPNPELIELSVEPTTSSDNFFIKSVSFNASVDDEGNLKTCLIELPIDFRKRDVKLEFLNRDGSCWAGFGHLTVNMKAPTSQEEAEKMISRAWDIRRRYLGLMIRGKKPVPGDTLGHDDNTEELFAAYGKPTEVRLTLPGNEAPTGTSNSDYTKSPHFLRDNEVISGLATAIAALARVKEL